MPQPFQTKLRGKPNAQYHTTGGLSNRPQLAIAYGEAMEEFAVCEGTLGTLYLILNNKNPQEHFSKLKSNVNYSQRIRLVRRSADNCKKEDRALIYAVTDRAQSASGMRNKIAHCFWGFSPSFPDDVILTPTNKLIKRTYDKLRRLKDKNVELESNEEELMLYNARDFNDIKIASINANAATELLTEYIMSSGSRKANYKAMILSDPQTKKRFDKRMKEKVKECFLKKWLKKLHL